MSTDFCAPGLRTRGLVRRCGVYEAAESGNAKELDSRKVHVFNRTGVIEGRTPMEYGAGECCPFFEGSPGEVDLLEEFGLSITPAP